MMPLVDRLLKNKEQFLKGKNVFIIGDIALDRTFICRPGNADHATHANEIQFDIEAYTDDDGETYDGDDYGDVGGCFDNLLLCKSLGAQTTLLTVTGDDHESERIRTIIKPGEFHKCLTLNDIQTVTRFRWFVLEGKESGRRLPKLQYRMNKEPFRKNCPHVNIDAGFADAEKETSKFFQDPKLVSWISKCLNKADAVLINDTEKGFLSQEVVSKLGSLMNEENSRRKDKRHPLCVLVDPKNNWEKFKEIPVSIIKGNHHEAGNGVSFRDIKFVTNEETISKGHKNQLIELGKRLSAIFGEHFQHIIVTLGSFGAMEIKPEPHDCKIDFHSGIPAPKNYSPDTTHCGDMFASALLAAYLVDIPLEESVSFANYVGALQYSMRLRRKVVAADIFLEENIKHYMKQRKPSEKWKFATKKLKFCEADHSVLFEGRKIEFPASQYAYLCVIAEKSNYTVGFQLHKDLSGFLVAKIEALEKNPLTSKISQRLKDSLANGKTDPMANLLTEIRKKLGEQILPKNGPQLLLNSDEVEF